MKRVAAFFIVMLIGWSCSDLGVDPRFSSLTVLEPIFTIPTGVPASLDTSVATRAWFDTTALTAELRGAGEQGAAIDSSYVTRVVIRSLDSAWPLGSLSTITVVLNGDTIARSSIPDYATAQFDIPKSAFTPAAFDLAAKPGDSVSASLRFQLRNSATKDVQVAADLSVATIARAVFQ